MTATLEREAGQKPSQRPRPGPRPGVAGEITARGFVPAAVTVNRSPEHARTGETIRSLIARAARAFLNRHGVPPSEVQVGDDVYAIAGVCRCNRLVLQSDPGSRVAPPACRECF